MIKKEQFVSPILMWLIVFAGILIILKIFPKVILFNIGFLSYIIFILTFIYWIYFFISAIFVHRKAALSVSRIDKIIKTGVYSRVRHPIYSADIILGAGIFFLLPSIGVLLSIIWLLFILIFWMKLEETALTRKFGKEYGEYKKKVPMVIPNWKRHLTNF